MFYCLRYFAGDVTPRTQQQQKGTRRHGIPPVIDRKKSRLAQKDSVTKRTRGYNGTSDQQKKIEWQALRSGRYQPFSINAKRRNRYDKKEEG